MCSCMYEGLCEQGYTLAISQYMRTMHLLSFTTGFTPNQTSYPGHEMLELFSIPTYILYNVYTNVQTLQLVIAKHIFLHVLMKLVLLFDCFLSYSFSSDLSKIELSMLLLLQSHSWKV